MSKIPDLPETNEKPLTQESVISSSINPNSSLKKSYSKKGRLKWTSGDGTLPVKPLGSKPRITKQKLEIEESLRDHLGTYMHEILQQAIEMAMQGDKEMIKLLVNSTLSKAAPIEETGEGREKVQVTIKDLTINSPTEAVVSTSPTIDKEKMN